MGAAVGLNGLFEGIECQGRTANTSRHDLTAEHVDHLLMLKLFECAEGLAGYKFTQNRCSGLADGTPLAFEGQPFDGFVIVRNREVECQGIATLWLPTWLNNISIGKHLAVARVFVVIKQPVDNLLAIHISLLEAEHQRTKQPTRQYSGGSVAWFLGTPVMYLALIALLDR